ncbi:MAG TPA: hypothetical protein VF601_09010 [Beijerinckiaceae bacterium]
MADLGPAHAGEKLLDRVGAGSGEATPSSSTVSRTAFAPAGRDREASLASAGKVWRSAFVASSLTRSTSAAAQGAPEPATVDELRAALDALYRLKAARAGER